jgi:PKD repeat protein
MPAGPVPAFRPFVAVITAAVVVLTTLVALRPATADTEPAAGTPDTVAADPLPTVQIDGVVWDQVIIGSRVYAGGSFSRARPAGAAAGTSTVTRNNVLAYDLHTGNLVTSWAPSANAQVMDVAASPDGRRLYVGGNFTSIGGSTRYRIAAFDTATGNLVTSFNASLSGRVETIAATNTTVYVGGAFTSANSQPRSKVAAFAASNGALLPWRPVLTDGTVYALQLSPDATQVVLGGSFTTVNGSSNPGFGLARVDATTAALLPLPANSLLRNAGTNAAVWGLSGDAENLYVVAYTYRGGGTLEGTAAVRWSTGQLYWVSDCHGDSYDSYPAGDVVYTASHNHYCGNNASFGQTEPWSYYRATARTTAATSTIGKEPLGYGNWEGRPGPTVLNWFPDINNGSYTGQNQGPWTVTGDASQGYVVFGGEFTRVNGTNQQGIVRFATREIAPNRSGPRFAGSSFPIQARAVGSGAVRVSWQANADYDNEFLTYRVLRNGVPVYEGKHPSQVWRRPWMGYTDLAASPTSQTYQVRVLDPFGNTASSPTVSVTANGSGAVGAYPQAVYADGPSHYWRLGESAGSTVRDTGATNDGIAGSGVALGAPGAIASDANRAVDLGSDLGGRVRTPLRALATNVFSIEAWVRASGSERGRLVGYGDAASATATSTRHDRVLYLDNAGRVNFGINPAQYRVITSPGSYDDAAWHHVVATMGADGMRLYVDGAQVASRATGTTAGNYVGSWILGADTLSGWPGRPSTDYFGGQLDEVAIYPRALPAAVVRHHYEVGRGAGGGNVSPAAAFTATTSGLDVAVDAAGSSDPDGEIDSFAWDFGDGTSATGQTAAHTYPAGGTYPITLTVTDDEGATGTATRTVSVTGPEDGGDDDGDVQVLALDAFERTTSTGWGSADVGGGWTLTGSSTSFSVSGGTGRVVAPSAGTGRAATLRAVSASSVDALVVAALDKAPTGSGSDLLLTGRFVSTGNEYRTQAKILANGTVRLSVRRILGGADTALAQVDVPGLTYAAGDRLTIRMQVEGSGPTALRARVWRVGETEPSAWHVQASDSSSTLQVAGGVGVGTYLSGSTTNAPTTATFDDLAVTPLA